MRTGRTTCRDTGNRMWSVFERRSDLEKILAVAEEGKILAAAEQLAISQPALTRAIARLEARFGGRLFERLSTGVRTTPLGDTAAALARGVLREIEAAEEKLHAALAGRTGSFRVTAAPMWMEAVLGPALAGFRERAPGIALTLRAAPFAEGLRLLVRGESDLHCGGADPGDPLPAFLRRERFPDIAAGIVAAEGHPLLEGTPAPGDLAAWPWIDFDPPTLDRLLERLFRDTGPDGRACESMTRFRLDETYADLKAAALSQHDLFDEPSATTVDGAESESLDCDCRD